MKKYSLLLVVVFAVACNSTKHATTKEQSKAISVDGKLWASFFQQQAAEYKALCFQAYNIAALRLDEALQQKQTKPLAIVTDLDETALDNSAYAVKCSLLGKDYDLASWQEWTSSAQSDTLAGSVSFFNYAASKNVEVFYITNREEKEREGTLKNLKKYGFPFADNAHLITKQNTSSKEQRRKDLAATHEIVLLLGDNLADFSFVFDKKPTDERLQNVKNNAALFGKKFIILPNTTYGDWEGALYKYNYKLSDAQKDSSLRAVLKSY